MHIFLIIAIAVVVLLMLSLFYGIVTDPARIDEEEDADVADDSPAERHGFLRSYGRLSKEELDDRIAEQSKSDYGADHDVNDI